MNFVFILCSVKKPESKIKPLRILVNNETVKGITNINITNINNTSSKKEATVFVVLDMHPGLMDPTETLGKL